MHLFEVGTLHNVIKHNQRYDIALALFLGVIFSMIIYNTFILFSTRDTIYALYIIYLLYIFIFIPFTIGYPVFHSKIILEYSLLWNFIGYFIPALFAIQYLRLKKYSIKLYYWILTITALLGLILPTISIINPKIFPSISSLYSLLILVYNGSLLGSAIFVYFRGYKIARFYILGWTFVVAAMFILIFMWNNLIPYNVYTRFIFYIGFSAEALLFAFALGDRINTIEKEKEEAQNKIISITQEQKQQLEEKVFERTKELKRANEEIATQNEEISTINEGLERKIEIRTKILTEQNELFKEYAFMNSHKVRGPLARILGMINLLKIEEDPIQVRTYINIIIENSETLDKIIKEMNDKLEEADLFEDID